MKRRPVLAMAVAVLFVLLWSGSALAVYIWVDEKGQTHITDYPKPEKPSGNASVDAEKKSESVSPVPSRRAVKTDQQQPSGVQPSSAVSVPAPPKNEQPVAPTSPNQPHLGVVSSPVVTPAASARPAEESPISPQEIRVDKNAPGAAMPNSGATRMAERLLTMALYVLFFGYLYFSLCLYLIAQKLNVSGAWVAWVPLFQVFTFLQSASKPAWWVLLFFVPFVNMVIPTYLWMCISENLGREKWFGLLMLVPVVNLIYLGMLAFSGQGSNNDVNAAVS